MAENCFINFMEGVNKFSSAERAKIAKSFREDLKHYKVSGVILNIVESTSDKVPVFINVMCQQARKKQFAADFTAECDRLRDIYKRNRTDVAQKIASLREIVLDSLK